MRVPVPYNGQHQEPLLADILNSVAGIVWSACSETLDLIYLSPYAQQVYGRTVAELLASPNGWLEAIHPADRHMALATYRALAQTGRQSFEYRIICPDQQIRWLHQQVQVVYGADGQSARLDGLTTDITDRKQAEADRQVRYQQLQALTQISAIALNASSLDVGLGEIVTAISDATNFSAVAIELYDADQQLMVLGGSQGIVLPDGLEPLEFPVSQTLSGQVAISQQPVVQQYGPGDAKNCGANAIFHQMTIATCVCLPLRIDQRMLAVVSLAHPDPMLVDDQLLDWLIQLTNPVAALISRKRAEDALQTNQELMDRFQHIAQMGGWERNFVEDTLIWTAETRRILGIAANAPVSFAWFMSHVHPQDVGRLRQAQHAAFAERKPIDLEYRFIRPDGEMRTIHEQGQATFGADGQCLYLSGIVLDITEQEQAEELLRRHERVLSATNDCIALVDRNYCYQLVNPAYCDRFNKSVDKIIGLTVGDLLGREVFESTIKPRLDCCFAGETVQYELWYEYPGGWAQFLSVTYDPYYESDGTISGVVASIRNITDLKQAEDSLHQRNLALRESEERFQEIAGTISQLFFMRSASTGQFLYVSPAYETMFGRTCESLYQDPESWQAAIYPEDRELVRSNLRRQFEGNSVNREYRIVRPDGAMRWLSAQVVTVLDEAGKPLRFIGVATDVTDRKRAETNSSTLTLHLQHLIHVIQELAASRDLTTIMAAVRTAARQLVQADGMTFVLRDEDLSYYADEDAIAPLWKGQRFPISACISGWVMLHGEAAVIADIFSDSRVPAELYEPTFVRSLAMLPIGMSDPVGAIGTYWAVEHTPSQDELDLLQTLANAAAIAIENVRLYEDLERRVQDRTKQLQQSLDFEALLKRITDKVRDSLDEDQILRTAVQELGQGLDVLCCNTDVYNLEQQTCQIRSEFSHGLPPSHMDVFPMAVLPEVFASLLQGHYLQFCLYVPNPVRPTCQLASILSCPIFDNQGTLGDLWVFKSAGEVFSEPEIRLVQQVANQCAIALRQSRLYQAAQLQVQELERLHRLKDDFLSTVSHELRSPMSNIKMATQMLEIMLKKTQLFDPDKASGDHSRILQYFQILNHECHRETRLINDLLDLSRLDADTDPLQLSLVCLQQWLPTIAAPFIYKMQEHSQQLQLQISPEVPPLTTDLAHLERILTELFHNACKYTPAGGAIAATVTVINRPAALSLPPAPEGSAVVYPSTGLSSQLAAAVPSGPQVQICLSNTGVEIPAHELPHIFERFYRVPNNDPWQHGGTGLGLALVKKLMDRLQGTITVRSGNGETCFMLMLPLALSLVSAPASHRVASEAGDATS